MLWQPDYLECARYFGGNKVIKEKSVPEELDSEWMQLIMEALELGIDKEEIRQFLNCHNQQDYRKN
nr:anti-repressor SinI family protein [Mesobacillus harenae]